MRYAFVPPRYFDGLAGGAETLMANVAKNLALRGDTVEIWTTCAKDNRSWENFFPAGEEISSGICIRRFPVDPRDISKWIPRQISISEGMKIGIEEELVWAEESVHSRALYAHIQKHGAGFDALFFGPYLFGTTLFGSQIHPEKSILIPCLHDECFAYLEVVRAMFRAVKGCVFNAEGERDLAKVLYGSEIRGEAAGMGFEPYRGKRPEPYFEEAGSAPYLLYLGRKETMKNVQVLIDYFINGKDKQILPEELKLVVAGGGSFSDLHRPKALLRGDIVDIDHVSEEDKKRLLAYAVALVQPSPNESFGIVQMEAWLLGTPVMVTSQSVVTKEHVVRSGGGLYFADERDFWGATLELLGDESLRIAMGENGKIYVETEYSWDAVIARFNKAVKVIFGEGNETTGAGYEQR